MGRRARVRARLRALLTGAICGLIALVVVPVAALAAGDENEASCPAATEASPGFRSSPPDCRAYEQVTPPFKDAYEPTPPIYRAPDGSRLIAEALGAFDGTEDNNTATDISGAVYQFARTPTGWESEALDPPASSYPSSGGVSLIAAAGDLGRTLWVLSGNADGTEATVYVREPGGGFSPLGPLQAPGALAERLPSFAGASGDLSQSLFSVAASQEEVNETDPRSAYWPGDDTILAHRPSLYDYADTGVWQSEPKLVGVFNEGPLRSNREALQISQCGTALGGIEPTSFGAHGDVYNAISESGATIFFTAAEGGCEDEAHETGTGPATDELYARVGGEHTVDISEPLLPGGAAGECSSGEPCEGAVPEPGWFRGASADGERVFFLSEQPLVNGAPAAGEGMDLYEERLDGDRVAEVRFIANLGIGYGLEEPGVARVSENGERVYFVATPRLAGAATREEAEPIEGEYNLYVYDTTDGALSFVATLSEFDEEDWWEEDARPVQSSADGEFLVFLSEEDLTPDDTSFQTPQLFEYDAVRHTLVRVSRGQVSAGYPGGYDEDGNVSLPVPYPSPFAPLLSAPSYDLAANPAEAASSLDLAEDGTVVFKSAQALTPDAFNERLIGEAGTTKVYAENVYEYSDGNVYLISNESSSGGEGEEAQTAAIGIDASAGDIFFSTAAGLVPQDDDTQADFYDAHTDGGFPAPASPLGCIEEACQGPGIVEPLFSPAASASQAPGGNLPAAPAPKSQPRVTDVGFSVQELTARQRRQLARSGHTELTVRTHAAGRLVLRASARVARRTTVVARAARTLARGGTAHVRVVLSQAARRALLHSGKLRVTLRVSFPRARGTTHVVTAMLHRAKATPHRRTAGGRA